MMNTLLKIEFCHQLISIPVNEIHHRFRGFSINFFRLTNVFIVSKIPLLCDADSNDRETQDKIILLILSTNRIARWAESWSEFLSSKRGLVEKREGTADCNYETCDTVKWFLPRLKYTRILSYLAYATKKT